jgi:hypothetical protein
MHDIIHAATSLSEAFMPAERSQNEAALQAARSLALALEMRDMAPFKGQPRAAAAATALARGTALSVEASYALEAAHRDFARMLPSTGLPELGWGCSGDCPDVKKPTGEVVEFPAAAA